MAQGLFCSLLIGTILNTIGTQFHIGFLTAPIIQINEVPYTIGGMASFMSGAAMAIAIGYALQGAAPGAVLPCYRRLCLQCTGRRGRSTCRPVCGHHRC